MKILQLCKKFPFPAVDGESLAIVNMARSLHALGHEIDALCMNTSRHYVERDLDNDQPGWYNKVEDVYVNNDINHMGAIKNLIKNESYHISRFVSKEYEDRLAEMLVNNEYDIIQLETLYLSPYLPKIKELSNAPIIMRSHNVEHEIWERVGKNEGGLLKRWYIRLLAKQLKKYEIDVLNDYDYLLSITPRDLKQFRKMGYINGAKSTPIGVDLSEYSASINTVEEKVKLGFLGSLDWTPNREGIEWFVNEIWPSVVEKHDDIELNIAGRNTPSQHQFNRNGINVLGEVPCAKKFLESINVLVVPLLSGSGMRVKIIEAMAMGRCVISTNIGIEGIHAVDGEHVLIADTKADFISTINMLKRQPQRITEIGQKAKVFIGKNYDLKTLGQELVNEYQKVIVKYSKPKS